MNNLEKQYLIKRESLKQADYFQSLLQEACRLNLLSDSELENIQLQSLQLLARQTERYTGGESSSVKTETAQGILQSVYYTVGLYLKSLPNPDMSIAELKQTPLAELYRHGRKLTEVQLEHARQLYNIIQNDCLATDNYAYNDTIQNGVAGFFRAYDADFAAHETPASIDYPLSSDKMELVGIEYIYSYLQKLFVENQFCKNFTDYDIHSLLRGYDDHYQDLLLNIFGLVLTNLAGSFLADKKLRLNIEPEDRLYIQHKTGTISREKLNELLRDASTHICKEFNITEKLQQEYIVETVINISAKLKYALENNRLGTIFITLKEEHPEQVIQYQDGVKMDDELFRSMVDEIRQCRYVSDKIAIIQREIHSIIDLTDILEGSCVFDSEFYEIFQDLGDMELALLLKRLPTHVIDADHHFTENEKDWHKKLTCFFDGIDPARRESIRALSEKIRADA